MLNSISTLRSLPHRLLAAAIFCGPLCFGAADTAWSQESGVSQASRRSTVSITPADGQPRQVAQAADAEASRLSPQERRQREQAALAFARQHHPELERLLRQLRGMDPKQYLKAVRDLSRVSDRLTALAERNPAQYESQLALWKANSTATLLAARLQLNPKDTELRERYREALQTRFEVQKQALRAELDRAQQRVDRLQENLQRLDQEGPQLIERQIRQLTTDSSPKKKQAD